MPVSPPGRPPPQRPSNRQYRSNQYAESGDGHDSVSGLVSEVKEEDTAAQDNLRETNHSCVALALGDNLIELVRLATQCLELLASQSVSAVNVMLS